MGQDERYGERLQEAASLHRSKQYQQAEEVYRSILADCPQHSEAHHWLGALLLDNDQYKGHLNLVDEAEGHFKQAISLCPKNARYRHSLGVAYQRKGAKVEAVECLERANEKDPMNIKILMDLARMLKDAGRPQRAVEVYKSVTLLQPDHPAAHYRAASVLRTLRRYEQALMHFRQHLRLFPDHTEAKFWIAALSGDTGNAEAPPPKSVASLFDQYSDHFDQHLVMQLGYKTPELLMEALLSAAATPTVLSTPWKRCIDLGVGTGLMGPLLRPHVAKGGLEGVDLSAGMVAKAKERGYDKLEVAELVQYLQDAARQMGHPGGTSSNGNAPDGMLQTPYGCVVAADVFVYLGDLKPVMSAAAAVSSTGALFAFSVEAGEGVANQAAVKNEHSSDSNQGSSRPYSLMPTGRYVHTARYVEDALSTTGWRALMIKGGTIRMNCGQPVLGHMCMAVRT